MARNRHRYSDDKFNESQLEIDPRTGQKIVKDGGRVRVSMMMMDSLQRGVVTSSMTVHDGTDDPFALNRPGYRFVDGVDRSASELARDERIYRDSNLWRSDGGVEVFFEEDGEDGDSEGARYPLSAGEGSACTVNGEPGTLVREGDWLVCRPVSHTDSVSMGDAREAAYRRYVDDLTNAWRR
jgi:hypothetical protein